MSNSRDRVPIEPQNIDVPLSQAAVFLVVTVRAGAEAMKHARGVVADIGREEPIQPGVEFRKEAHGFGPCPSGVAWSIGWRR